MLSQKPFVLDLEDAKKLVDMANHQKVNLAVNQNGRWAPHFSYIRNAVRQGLISTSIDFSLQWDQTWIKGIPSFEEMEHLILFDFAIHWFDITACIMGIKTQKYIRICSPSRGSSFQTARRRICFDRIPGDSGKNFIQCTL